MVLAPLAVSQTFSRLSFVIMPVVLVSQFWDMFKGGRRNRVYLVFTVLVVAAVLAATVDWGAAIERATTISPAIQGVPTDAEEELNSSRMHHWLGAIAMFNDNPVLGVGYGNFGIHFQNTYQFLVPDKWVIRSYNVQRSPHSTFLGFLAELGLVGTMLWLWLLATPLLNVRASWSAGARAGHRYAAVLSQAVFFALVAYVIYSVFAEVHLHKLLWLLFGLAEAVRRLTFRERANTIAVANTSASPVGAGGGQAS